MLKPLTKLSDYWFEPAPPQRLAALRIAVGCFVLYYLADRYSMLLGIAASDGVLFEPVGVARILAEPLDPEVFRWLLHAAIALNVLFVLGLFHRYCAPLFAVVVLFVFCYRNSWSMIYHSRNVAVLHAMILCLVPAADAWSVDRFFQPRTTSDRVQASAGWMYGWPIRLLCATTVVTYVLAGIAKVSGPSGWSWAGGEHLRLQVAIDAVRKELLGTPIPELAINLFDQTWLFGVLGIGTLLLEVGAPVAMLHRRAAALWAIATWGMHWGIYLVMGITFHYQLTGLVFLPFFRVERILFWRRHGRLILEEPAAEA